MHKVFLALFGLLLFIGNSSAQLEYSMHFIRQAPQSSYTNPAFRTNHKNHLTLPSFMYNYGNNAFSYDQLIRPTENGDSIFIDGDQAIAGMSKNNLIVFQAQLDILGFSFSKKDWYFQLLFSEKMDAQFKYPRELAKLVWDGNAQYVGQTIDIGPGINATYYNELSLGINKDFDAWTAGFRLRLLSGIANIYSRSHALLLTTAKDHYGTSLNTDYEINTSGLTDIEGKVGSPGLSMKNPGVGIDLGVNHRINEKFEVGLSVIDLGQITWKSDIKTWRSNASFVYTGIDVNDFVDDETVGFEKYRDSINELYFQEEVGESYKSGLIPKVFLSGLYHFNETTDFGAMLNLEFFDGIQPGFSIYAGKSWSGIVDAGLTYSIKNKRFTNFGCYIGFGPDPFKVFVATDNLATMFAMRKGRTVTVRYGININIGKREKKVKEPDIFDETEEN